MSSTHNIRMILEILPALIPFLIVIPHSAAAASLADYCIVPPYLAAPVKPNVNIVIDFSQSMQFPTYLPCASAPGEGNVAACGSASSGYSFDSGRSYYGYFSEDAYYGYTGGRFAPSSCVHDGVAGGPGCISGKLLNWITTTRIDTVRKVLVGGRTRTGASDTLESEGAAYSYTDSALGCTFTVNAVTTANRTLTIEDAPGGACPLGSLSSANIRIQDDPTRIAGIIQKYYPRKIDLEFTVSNSDNAGVIKAGKNPTVSSLISALGNEQPTGGAPTGEALWEVVDYFRQADDHSYAANNSEIKPGNSSKDPFYDNGVPLRCRKAFTLLISDGVWNGAVDPVLPSYTLRTEDLRGDPLRGRQQAGMYVVHAFGDADPALESQGRTALLLTAIFGGFRDGDGDRLPFPFTGITPGAGDCGSDYGNTPKFSISTGHGTFCNSRAAVFPPAECTPSVWDMRCGEWGRRSTGLPDNFFEAGDGAALERALTSAFDAMLSSVASGTAASVVNTTDGSGAVLAQALFHPKRDFEGESVSWTGEIQGLWYYIDPFLERSSMREEVWSGHAAHVLDLREDPVLSFDADSETGETTVRRQRDTDGDGKILVDAGSTSPDNLRAIWKGGLTLWRTAAADRTIETTVDGRTATSFTAGAAATLAPYLGVEATAASGVIRYVRGEDAGAGRSRRAFIEGAEGIWKLGDIMSSTPRLQTSAPLNGYHLAPPTGYGDRSYGDFIGSSTYRRRGRVFVGANDGMLHVFRTGVLSERQRGTEKAQVTGSDLGTEEYAFIPKGTLPYLKYLGDPQYDHLSYVDGPIRVFDASIASGTGGDGCSGRTYWNCRKQTTLAHGEISSSATSWRTVVIVGTGLGGASRAGNATCGGDTCVLAPVGDPASVGKWIGYSSYVALDVTDPDAPPRLMWDFAGSPDHPGQLGFATTGPAIIRVGSPDRNGRWFAVFASGPTGPIDTDSRQFLGRSDQQLRLFVVDIATGELVKTIDTDATGAVLPENASGGSLSGSVVDTDRWNPASSGFYSDDAAYIGYVAKSTTGTWTKGGVLRLSTGDSIDPGEWKVSMLVTDVGPVTSSIAKLQDRSSRALWIFFGTGRYFYRRVGDVDSPDQRQALYGIQEPCYNAANALVKECTASVEVSALRDQTTSPAAVLNGRNGDAYRGWLVKLDSGDAGFNADRVITDPVAARNGAVFFTSYRPATDPCSIGGSFLWALRYDTGGTPPGGAMSGKALLQVSTGTVKEISLARDFGAKDGRRMTDMIPGVPPTAQGLALASRPRPARQLLHIQER